MVGVIGHIAIAVGGCDGDDVGVSGRIGGGCGGFVARGGEEEDALLVSALDDLPEVGGAAVAAEAQVNDVGSATGASFTGRMVKLTTAGSEL